MTDSCITVVLTAYKNPLYCNRVLLKFFKYKMTHLDVWTKKSEKGGPFNAYN